VIPRLWQQETPYGVVTVVTSEHGVRAIGLPDDDGMLHEGWAVDDDVKSERDDDVAGRLDDWFNGRVERLDIPLDLTGLDGFKRDVLETLVREVGWGETVSYGELAEMAGRPRAARAVGSAMASNPLPFVIPCHRVIASGGRIGGYGGTRDAVALKRELLAREGVTLP
jgi:methylated-DNA-[protein]-cysteine S-methyltransferase